MTDYTQLHYNVDSWYDYLNDSHDHVGNDEYSSKWNRYVYTYLSCISEFPDDHE